MSAVPKCSPVPQPAPPRPRPEAVVPAPRPSGRRKWLLLAVVLALIAGSAAFLLRTRRAQKSAAAVVVRTAKAVRGAVRNTVRLSGSIAATHYADIVAPLLQAPESGRGMVLLKVPESGSEVKEGQVVAEMDAQPARDHLDDVEAQVIQGEFELRRVRAYQDAETESIRQRVRVAKGALEKAQQNIRAAETRNRIDQELLKLAVSEAQATYQEALRQVELTVERQAAALRIAELNQEFRVRHRNRHQQDIDRLTIQAPMDGRVVMRPIYRHGEQGQVRVGDELSPGQSFMRIVDTSEMRLDTSMNQAESELVHIGQRAMIRFDAYPEIQLNGKVVAVGTIAAGGRRVSYYVRRVPVRISIEGTDPRVLPDLTASADVVLAEQDDRIVVPREAVLEEDGKSVVYVKLAGTFTPREVEVGIYSNTEAGVVYGLHAGEEVALERPF